MESIAGCVSTGSTLHPDGASGLVLNEGLPASLISPSTRRSTAVL